MYADESFCFNGLEIEYESIRFKTSFVNSLFYFRSVLIL
jgi:hypothetical protein